MTVSEAVVAKLWNICDEKKITPNKLSTICGITQSTIENILNGNSRNPKLLTIVRICDGLEISIHDFFNDPIFLNLDRED